MRTAAFWFALALAFAQNASAFQCHCGSACSDRTHHPAIPVPPAPGKDCGCGDASSERTPAPPESPCPCLHRVSSDDSALDALAATFIAPQPLIHQPAVDLSISKDRKS